MGRGTSSGTVILRDDMKCDTGISLTSNAPCQLNIALHDRYTSGVYSTEVPEWSRISVT